MFIILFDTHSQTIQVKNTERTLHYIDLVSLENEPFFRRNQELPKLVMEAIMRGEVSPYFIDYDQNARAKLLTMEEWSKRVSYEVMLFVKDELVPVQTHFFPRDFHTLSIDRSTGVAGGKKISQVNYINFYSVDYDKKDKAVSYRFSLKWEDLLFVLSKHKDKLYYTNSYGSWWRGNVFLSHSNYFIDKGVCGDFIRLSKRLPDFQAENFRNRGTVYKLDKYEKDCCEGGEPLDFFMIEEKRGGHYEISDILVEEITEWDTYGNGDRYAFQWSDFLKIAKDSTWRRRSEVFTLYDALKLQKLAYAQQVSVVISKKGKFIKGGKDPLCAADIINSCYLEKPDSFENFYTIALEGLYLGDSLNLHLHRPGHSISELIHEYILSGKVLPFSDDSFSESLTIEEFIEGATVYRETNEYNENSRYKKGDTIRFAEKFYTVLEDLPADPKGFFDKLKSKIRPLELPLYSPRDLVPLQLVQKITFNKEGENKKYELLGVGIIVPTYANIKGIEIPLGFVRWEELRKELLSDTRAMIEYKGKTMNLVELLEDRHFFSAIYKTEFLQVAE